MDQNIKGNGRVISPMEMGYFIIMMGESMKESGLKERCMG